MGMSDRALPSFLPPVNDLLAAFVLAMLYLVRLYAIATPAVALPWWSTLMTDVLLPGVAGTWVWVMAMYTAYVALGEP